MADPRFSPDGKRLAVVVSSASDTGPKPHIWWTIGDELRQATQSSKAERMPRWAPSGRALAFLSSREGTTQIYSLSSDGGEAVALTHSPTAISQFVWSPDGKSIAYLAAPSGDTSDAHLADDPAELERLWIVDCNALTTRQVSSNGYRIDELQWSTRGLFVVATASPRIEKWTEKIYTVNERTGGFTVAASPAPPFEHLSVLGRGFAYLGTTQGGPIPHDLIVHTAAGVSSLTRSLDRAVTEVHWQNDDTPWFRVSDGFVDKLYADKKVIADHVSSFDVTRDGAVAYVASGA